MVESQLAQKYDIDKILSKLDRFPIDRKTIPQDRLDLVNRTRTSLFPWRGQFSPELIELLFERYAPSNAVVFDPFVGSGNALFEAARKSYTCFGTEINPAAVEMARTVQFVNHTTEERMNYIRKARSIINEHLPFHGDLFSFEDDTRPSASSIEEALKEMIDASSTDPLLYNLVINTVMRFMMFSKTRKPEDVLEAFKKHVSIVQSLPHTENPCRVFHADARQLPFEITNVDLIVTSPPYINVFNYHQNFRKVMELAGWNLLEVAKSEIGSNRKNRRNRFLTVVQYTIDVLQALRQMRRVLNENGRIIIIIGRESTVRGVAFENFRILSALAIGGAGLGLLCRQERRFVTRYGETIYEDLLHFAPVKPPMPDCDNFARMVGVYFLNEALKKQMQKDVRVDIVSAIHASEDIQGSPLFVADKTRNPILAR